MTWAKFHAESERLAIDAELASRTRNTHHSLLLYKQAADAERKALDQLDASKVRTRGITAVSAVALWFKAGEYALAEQLAHSTLADPLIPEFAREELRNLVQAIRTERSKRTASERSCGVWVIGFTEDDLMWEPIETAPKDTDVLVYYEYGSVAIAHIARNNSREEWCRVGKWHMVEACEGWWAYTPAASSIEPLEGNLAPTHWMPYSPPEKQSQ